MLPGCNIYNSPYQLAVHKYPNNDIRILLGSLLRTRFDGAHHPFQYLLEIKKYLEDEQTYMKGNTRLALLRKCCETLIRYHSPYQLAEYPNSDIARALQTFQR
jgi:hypothetical protein